MGIRFTVLISTYTVYYYKTLVYMDDDFDNADDDAGDDDDDVLPSLKVCVISIFDGSHFTVLLLYILYIQYHRSSLLVLVQERIIIYIECRSEGSSQYFYIH
jgi:hypothetical protein